MPTKRGGKAEVEFIPQQGEIISRTIYARVGRDPEGGGFRALTEMQVFCEDLNRKDGSFHIRGLPLIKSFVSASQSTTTEKVTRTEMAHLLVNAGALPFTVRFRKANGQEREMVGVLVKHEDMMGRSMVRDFDVAEGMPVRQVDHRTIYELVLDGVKYVLK